MSLSIGIDDYGCVACGGVADEPLRGPLVVINGTTIHLGCAQRNWVPPLALETEPQPEVKRTRRRQPKRPASKAD